MGMLIAWHVLNKIENPHRYLVQFSTARSGTRLNSLTLFVTSVAPALRACAAMNRSIAPMGVPRCSRPARMSP